jgi:hypothetical protein
VVTDPYNSKEDKAFVSNQKILETERKFLKLFSRKANLLQVAKEDKPEFLSAESLGRHGMYCTHIYIFR